MFFYLKARLSPSGSGGGCWTLAALMFLCAVLSKENAVMFLAVLFLLERIFFSTSSDSVSPYGNILWGVVIFCAGIIGAFIFMPFKPSALLHVYSARSFSFWERVLTEPRIVLFYLSQIFYPVPSRLSVAHDVYLSKSLFDPPITFFAIFLIAALILLAIRWRRRKPLLAFAILFYFANHVVESTIIPLELIFEHRNYLPSLFLFVPVAAGVRQLMNRYRNGRYLLYPAMVICLVAVIVILGLLTRERNRIWLSPETLWYDAMRKAPNQAGPVNNIAAYIGWGKAASPEKKELAIRLFTRAAAMNHPSVLFRARIYDNIGTLSAELGKSGPAEAAYRKAIDLDEKFLKARYNLARLLAATAQWEKALAAADELISASRGTARPEYYETRGFVLLWMSKPDEALDSLRQSLNMGLFRSSQTLLYTGCVLSRLGRFDQAERFYKLAQGQQPLQPLIFFLLIENSIRAGDRPAAERFARILFSERNVYDILKTLKKLPEPGRTVPLDKDLVAPVIKTVYYAIGREAQEKAILPR
jgi:tetratricopeptide (TPR) repeat protein